MFMNISDKIAIWRQLIPIERPTVAGKLAQNNTSFHTFKYLVTLD